MNVTLNLGFTPLEKEVIKSKMGCYDISFISVKGNDDERSAASTELMEMVGQLKEKFKVRNLSQNVISPVQNEKWDVQLTYDKEDYKELQMVFNSRMDVSERSHTCKEMCEFLKGYPSVRLEGMIYYRVLICGDEKLRQQSNRLWRRLERDIRKMA